MQEKFIHFSKLCTKHKLVMISSPNKDFSFEIKSPAVLKHLSDFTEEGGIELKQNFNFLRTAQAQIYFFSVAIL